MSTASPDSSNNLTKDDLTSAFKALGISGGLPDSNHPTTPERLPVPKKEGGFIGGFYFSKELPPSYGCHTADRRPDCYAPEPYTQPAFFTMPIPVVHPQSPTTNHAQRPPLRVDASSEPESFISQAHTRSTGDIPLTSTSSILSTSATPPRNRASSAPPSTPTPSKGNTVRCSAITRATGQRCKKRCTPLFALFASHPDVDEEPVMFCGQHKKIQLKNLGFYSRKVAGHYIDFTDWIPDYLEQDTQLALRVEMEKGSSNNDTSGYIYTYEIRDPTSLDKVQFKVGRTVNLVKRLDQWEKQCSSKEQILRGWWPGILTDDHGIQDLAVHGSMMKGCTQAGEQGPLIHRLERLVHLELADLAVNAPYLKSDFLKTKDRDTNSAPTTPTKKRSTSSAAKLKILQIKPCSGGKIHKEIFPITRAKTGHYKDKEWELIVKPVIERWGEFVRKFV
ncbi:hypothetical protein HWV62_33007 [Athelia sp. TMB]|nr:hypothetical protein HWV62_33007 [Athelia sp. TMB]